MASGGDFVSRVRKSWRTCVLKDMYLWSEKKNPHTNSK